MLRMPAVHAKLITAQLYKTHQLGISWRRGEQNHCLLTSGSRATTSLRGDDEFSEKVMIQATQAVSFPSTRRIYAFVSLP